MLKIIIPSIELFDEKTNIFFSSKQYELQLEHSLVSLSKWESKWKKPFLTKENRTSEEVVDYIRSMTITQNVDQEMYNFIKQEEIDKIMDYIDDPMTATTFLTIKQKASSEIITSELIYYWMIAFQINWEAQKWHLNRLLTLIKVCDLKNQSPKKKNRKEIIEQNKALNAARKAKLNTTG